MTENVLFIDRWMNTDGSQRTTPLKKARNIPALEFFLPEFEYSRIKKMKNPMETFQRPEEHMTIYRDDGTYVLVSSEHGLVKMQDSRNKNMYITMRANDFLNRII